MQKEDQVVERRGIPDPNHGTSTGPEVSPSVVLGIAREFGLTRSTPLQAIISPLNTSPGSETLANQRLDLKTEGAKGEMVELTIIFEKLSID
jgi:hypothetical protein